jgi:negative regulator of flagellin synthesis FlgM
MKIGPSSSDGLRADGKTVGAERASAARPGSGTDPVSGAQPVDRVSLTGKPVLASASGATPFDDRKVEEVRRAIAEGRFPVDAKRVAQELIAEARDFLGIAQQGAR